MICLIIIELSFSDIHIGIPTVYECKHILCWFPTLTNITWIFSYKKVLFCRFLYTKMMSNIFVGIPTVASVIYKRKTKVILKEHPHFLYVREWLLTSSIWAGHVLERRTNITKPFYRWGKLRLSVVKSMTQSHRAIKQGCQDLNFCLSLSKAQDFPTISYSQDLPLGEKLCFLPKAVLVLVLRSFISSLLIQASWLWWHLTLIAPVKAHIPVRWAVFPQSSGVFPIWTSSSIIPRFYFAAPNPNFQPTALIFCCSVSRESAKPPFQKGFKFWKRESKLPNFPFLIKKK